jgi:Protein of unknown function (DUF3048) N-terminal domain/Protein of unknown function (DUF3048) C-terminal domain
VLGIILLMNLGFKKNTPKLRIIPKKPTALPGFRSESELPKNSTVDAATTKIDGGKVSSPSVSPTSAPSEDDISLAFDDASDDTDPTNLTLDRAKQFDKSLLSEQTVDKPKMPRKAKKIYFFILIGLFIAVAGGSGVWYILQKKSDKSASNQPTNTVAKVDKKQPKQPESKPAPITGVDVPTEISLRPTTAIMIENSVDARPQSGLYDADMVVEAVAEGGITRFVALFQSGQPTEIGPIRSARPYYVQIAKTFDAAYVHAGGSPDAISLITDLGVKDMSAFEENGTYIRSDKRAAPHNLYSSMSKIDTRRNDLGYKTSNFATFSHKNDTPQTPSASVINFTISSESFNPSFSYVASNNNYRRSEGGEPQLDAANQAGQLAPKVIIGLVTTKGSNDAYSTYRLTGNGEVKVFQDGIVSDGTWSKDKDDSQFVIKDKNGLPMNLNKGQIWMTLLGSTSNISYTP